MLDEARLRDKVRPPLEAQIAFAVIPVEMPLAGGKILELLLLERTNLNRLSQFTYHSDSLLEGLLRLQLVILDASASQLFSKFLPRNDTEQSWLHNRNHLHHWQHRNLHRSGEHADRRDRLAKHVERGLREQRTPHCRLEHAFSDIHFMA